jgi:hypothetical protein
MHAKSALEPGALCTWAIEIVIIMHMNHKISEVYEFHAPQKFRDSIEDTGGPVYDTINPTYENLKCLMHVRYQTRRLTV